MYQEYFQVKNNFHDFFNMWNQVNITLALTFLKRHNFEKQYFGYGWMFFKRLENDVWNV